MVQLLPLRVRPDQPVEVARLELVGLLDERLEVADPEVADARRERVAERDRAERRVAAGAAAADREALAVDDPLLGEPAGAGDAVVDVDDAPLALEALAVVAAVAGRAAVVDVEDREAAAREQLDASAAKRGRGLRGRAAMARDDERRQLARRAPRRPVRRAGRGCRTRSDRRSVGNSMGSQTETSAGSGAQRGRPPQDSTVEPVARSSSTIAHGAIRRGGAEDGRSPSIATSRSP